MSPSGFENKVSSSHSPKCVQSPNITRQRFWC